MKLDTGEKHSGGLDEKEAGEAMAVAAILAGAGYLWWRTGHHLPFPVGHPAVVPPGWLKPAAVCAALLLFGGAAALVWRAWHRRVARKLWLALLEAGAEGRHPTNREKTVRPKIKKVKRIGPHGWWVALEMPVRASSLTLTALLPHVEERLGWSLSPTADNRRVWVRVGTRRLPRFVAYGDFDVHALEHLELPISIGYASEVDEVVDLAVLPHLLVGGKAGGGKSVFLRQLLARLADLRSPEHLRLVLADLKGGMEFTLFRDLPHLMCPVASDAGSFAQALEVACAELNRRMELFREAGVESLEAWNRTHPGEQMPYVVVVVDEVAQVTLKPASQDDLPAWKVNMAALSTISRLGRAPGVHLILCTQRPDADTVPGQIKGNMGAVLAFKAQDMVQSQILLGQNDPSASLIPADVPGRGVWKWIDAARQVQTPFLEVAVARDMVTQLERRWPAHTSTTEPARPRAETPVDGPPIVAVYEPEEWPDVDASPSEHRGVEGMHAAAEHGGRAQRGSDQSRPKTQRGYDVSRLKVGKDYEFRLRDGRAVRGTVQAVDFEQGRGGANADGEHPLWVSGDGRDHWLSPREIAEARRAGTDRKPVAS